MINISIKEWRIKQGLSQKEAALRIGVHLQTYKGWETGDHWPSPLNWHKLKMAGWRRETQ